MNAAPNMTWKLIGNGMRSSIQPATSTAPVLVKPATVPRMPITRPRRSCGNTLANSGTNAVLKKARDTASNPTAATNTATRACAGSKATSATTA